MSTGYESQDLLRWMNQFVGRAGLTADSISPFIKYDFLATAQDYVIQRIASASAKTLFSPPEQLTTADGGLTFTFGTDANGYPLFPMGRTGIYANLASIPGGAWTPGIDYLDEGTTIRMPNNTPYTGTLYWYGLQAAPRMSDTVQPILMPPSIRMLIARRAAAMFAESGQIRNPQIADRQTLEFEKEFGEAMTLLRKHFKNSGCLGRMLMPWGVGNYTAGWPGAWWS